VDDEYLTVDEIRAQMREIRRDLPANVHGIVVNAGQMFDWKNYVRSFPWLAIGGAALVGYLLVPRRRPAVIPPQTQEALEKLSDRIQTVAVAPRPAQRSTSLAGTILPILGGIALRIGTAYLTRVGSEFLNRMAHHADERPRAPSASDRQSMPLPRTRPNYPR
jgi:hypothetical protein